MIKRSTFYSALAAILFSTSALAQVAVTTKLPATAAPGSSFTMELNVAKADVSGFAKLQQQLPPGFTAEVQESANATFSFKDQKVKFLWMALPNDDFKVSYKVTIDPSLSGNQIIEGTFAYIQNNETEKFIIPKDIISIQSDQADAAKQAAMDKILADQRAKEEAANAAREEAAPAEEVVEETAEVAEEVVEEVEETTEAVEEVAEEVAEEVVEEVEEVDNSAEIAAAEAAEEAARQEEERKAKEAKAEKKRQEAEKRKQEQAAAVEATPKADYNDAMMKSKPGLVFRVQVAAGPNRVDPSFFQSKYGISESIVIEEHEGLYKYVVGEFGSYRPAKTFSNELRDNNGVDGPFVTSYNDGTRIHVKEALDIAGQ